MTQNYLYDSVNDIYLMNKNQILYHYKIYQQPNPILFQEFKLVVEDYYYAENDQELLEILFTKYNTEKLPRNMRSLSVGDLVKLNSTIYQCCGVGWQQL